MKRLLYWLIAIAAALAMVWGVRYYIIKRVFYRPDWYEQQKQAGTAMQPSEWSQPAADEPPGVTVLPESSSSGRTVIQPQPSRTAQRRGDRQSKGGVTTRSYPSNESVGSSEYRSETRLERTLREEGSVRIPAGDLVPLLIEEMRGRDDFDPYSVVRGAKSTLTPGQMTIEMILDIEKIPSDRLTPDGVRVLNEIRKLVPEKYLHEVYIKANLLPRVNGDQIEFADTSTISIGRISLRFTELEKRLDIQPRMDMNAFTFRDLQVQNGYILLYK